VRIGCCGRLYPRWLLKNDMCAADLACLPSPRAWAARCRQVYGENPLHTKYLASRILDRMTEATLYFCAGNLAHTDWRGAARERLKEERGKRKGVRMDYQQRAYYDSMRRSQEAQMRRSNEQ